VRYSRNLLRYSQWQALDFAIERAAGLLLVAAVILVPIILLARQVRQEGGAISTTTGQEVYTQLGGHLAYFLVIMVVVGMVAESRRSGTYRFVFSKPVSMPAYYAQQYVIWGLGMVAFDLFIAAALSVAVGSVAPWGLVSYHLLAYMLIGGLTFFFSTFFRHDWAGVVALVVPAELLVALWNPPSSSEQVILAALPPVKALSDLQGSLLAGATPAVSDVALVAGYGLLFLVAGLVILDRREFAR
jgi:hypothetical protein